MGHAQEILTFSGDKDKSYITSVCTEWGNYNCDPHEHGGNCDCGGIFPNFTTMVFDHYEDAENYLNETFGHYRQIAVQYKKYPVIKPTKVILNLERRLDDYRKKISELEQKAHYEGVSAKYIKCKNCGSSLSTAFCGKNRGPLGLGHFRGFSNDCPVCGKDLRPQSVKDKIAKYKQTVQELTEALKQEQRALEEKQKNKAVLYWAVACEVHC